MRTTITLDDDLAVHLEQHRTEHDLTFKEALNQAVRAGLARLQEHDAATSPVAPTEPLPLGRRLLADVDDIAETLAIAEGEDFRRCTW